MIKLQKGDYVLTSDIESNEMNDRIVEEMERQGFALYGAKNKGEFFNIGINSVGEIVGGLDRCAYRQLTPAQILGSAQWAPEVGGLYKHNNGGVYEVTGLANKNTERPGEYPVTVIYKNIDNHTVWCRPIKEWSRSFKPFPTEEDREVEEMMRDADLMRVQAERAYRAGYRKQPQPAEDMTDPANWRAGDIFKVVDGKRSLDKFESGTVVRKVSDDNNRYEYLDGRDWWALHDYQVRFIRRP